MALPQRSQLDLECTVLHFQLLHGGEVVEALQLILLVSVEEPVLLHVHHHLTQVQHIECRERAVGQAQAELGGREACS